MENHLILSTIRMKVLPNKRDEVLRILKLMAEQCRNDLCCLSYHIYEDLQEKNVLLLEVVWSADKDLEPHIRSDGFRDLLRTLEMSVKEPEIRFDAITKTTGIETIENIRCRA
jgi:quinol monooxygenase YgiN